jgi:hypothetical protein
VIDLPAFFADYRTAFARLEPDALEGYFALPLHLVSATDGGAMVTVADGDQWPGLLAGLLGAYRSLGVADAAVLDLQGVDVAPDVASARVRWELRRDDGTAVYAFTAVYTVVAVDGRPRIAAIAHDELPQLQAALAALGAAG